MAHYFNCGNLVFYMRLVIVRCTLSNRMLGVIKRNFDDRSMETIMPLYKSLLRPHLEYCVPIWSPYYKKDIELIEGV